MRERELLVFMAILNVFKNPLPLKHDFNIIGTVSEEDKFCEFILQ